MSDSLPEHAAEASRIPFISEVVTHLSQDPMDGMIQKALGAL